MSADELPNSAARATVVRDSPEVLKPLVAPRAPLGNHVGARSPSLLAPQIARLEDEISRVRKVLRAQRAETRIEQQKNEHLRAEVEALRKEPRNSMESLTSLLAEDAVQSMPPYELWLSGRDDILAWWSGPGAACEGSRLIPTTANGLPAFGQYRPSGPGGRHEPWALQVLDIVDGEIVEFTAFLDTERLFPLFGLPDTPP
jgi:RNA polymerase sigma-70 factor (ECF subfamily)